MKPGPIQQKWIADLRSGNYEQTEGVLCDGKGYCCLGVAAFVTLGIPKTKDLNYMESYGLELDNGEVESNYLTPSVRDALGLCSMSGEAKDGEFPSLPALNDGVPSVGVKKHTFNEIADHLEQHFDQYFVEEK